VADHSNKFLDDEYKTWFDPELKDIYYHSSAAMNMHTLAVHPHSKQTGVATALSTELERQLLTKGITYLFSIITIGPLTNCPSLLLHTKLGFERVAMSRPRDMFNLKNYLSVLLCKRIKETI
jgi:N-acetylglutamate synthase-like GNAT family acetyltransferase